MTRATPGGLRNASLAVDRYGAAGEAWLDGMWAGDPLADAVAEEGGPGAATVRRAVEQGIEAAPDASPAVRALFAQLDREPGWLDHDRLDRAADHLIREGREVGIALGAASLVAGAVNSIAGKPLVMTGRYAEDVAVRNVEVGAWLTEVATPGGLRRDGQGFERTVRVRMIHAMVRRHLARDPRWDLAAWGTPIPQPYMAFTIAEFGHIALAAMYRLGVRYTDRELADIYHLWRYVGHLIGVDEQLNPVEEGDHRRIEELYTLTSPGPDEGDRRFVASLTADYLAPELAVLAPEWLPGTRWAAVHLVHGLQRAFVGDAAADALRIPDNPLKYLPLVAGPVLAAARRVNDLVPGGKARRTRAGYTARNALLVRLRRTHGVTHDLVDAAPGSHPATVA